MENENEITETIETGGRSGGSVVDLTIDDLVKESVASMPDVSAQVVNDAGAAGGDLAGVAPVTTGLVDKYDRPFDPELHVTNSDGSPKINKAGKAAGKIAIKRFKRKPARASRVAKPPKSKPDTAVESKRSGMSPEIAGKVAADLTFNVAFALGGDEWRPIVDSESGVNEPETMRRAYGEYFAARGIDDVPPGWILVVALGSYALPRFTMPKTSGRLIRGLGKLKLGGKWLLSKLRRGKSGSLSDPGNDGKRQDDIGEETGKDPETAKPGGDLSRSYP